MQKRRFDAGELVDEVRTNYSENIVEFKEYIANMKVILKQKTIC